MSLDPKYLELMTMGPFDTKEDEKQSVYARKILPLRKKGNLLLCAILIGNVASNVFMSIITADSTSGAIGFVISTVVILIFAEITP
jgi:metal transporter CNNM